MKIDVVLIPDLLKPGDVDGRVVVVIDVLRASTTMITALANGAEKIVPVKTVVDVMKVSSQDGKTFRCGEREGKRLPGFDMGNSPAEYGKEVVARKTLYFTSTNGSQIFESVTEAEAVAVGGFVNRQAVVEFLCSKGTDVLLVCSGAEGGFSLEDAVCAGMFVDALMRNLDENTPALRDEARAAAILYNRFSDDLLGMVEGAAHGATLTKLGMGSDLPLCVAVDTFDAVPVLKNGVLIINEPMGT